MRFQDAPHSMQAAVLSDQESLPDQRTILSGRFDFLPLVRHMRRRDESVSSMLVRDRRQKAWRGTHRQERERGEQVVVQPYLQSDLDQIPEYWRSPQKSHLALCLYTCADVA